MEFSGTTGSARGAEIRENGSWSCAPASGLFFLPIKDQLTVRLEGSKVASKARSIDTGTSVA